MPSLTSATVVLPSDIIDFLDGARVCDLLVDEGEDEIVVSDLDTNARALKLIRSAWYRMVMACRRGDIYTARELVDLANDDVRGESLLELIAKLFWCRCIGRRGYTENEPQSKDPKCKEAEDMLEELQAGHRIFVLEDVEITNSSGVATGATYVNVKGEPTTLQVGKLGVNCCDRSSRFWGCTSTHCASDPIPSSHCRPHGCC